MSIPPQVLDAVGEFSPEGFIIFSISPEGSPEVTYTYNSDITSIALQKFVSLWSQAIEDAQNQQMMNSLNHSCEDEED